MKQSAVKAARVPVGTVGVLKAIVFPVVFLVACMIACGAFAGQAHAGELVAGSQVKAHAPKTEYNVWVGGVRVTSANKGNVLGGKKKSVVYNPKTNTLTLRNAKITGGLSWDSGYGNDGILSTTGTTLNIKLVGANTITVPAKSASISNGIAAFNESTSAFADIMVYGSGSLTAKAASATYYSNGISVANLTVKGSAKLVLEGKGVSNKDYDQYGGYGVNATSAIIITGNARVAASGTKAAFYTYEGRVTPTYKKYTPRVKAGSSAKSIKVNRKKPAKSVYSKYKYVSIVKAK